MAENGTKLTQAETDPGGNPRRSGVGVGHERSGRRAHAGIRAFPCFVERGPRAEVGRDQSSV